MPWLQLRINTPPNNAAQIEHAMLKFGAQSVTFEDNADQPIFEPELGETPLWSETRVTGLFDAGIDTEQVLKSIVSQYNQETAALRWEQLEDKDWQREWIKYFNPIQCGDNFWICPSWTERPNPDAINLMLDPGLAFGTGTHPTTFLCLQWIAKQSFIEKRVIDYGCGSGILGIAALLHGANHVIGVDIDPQALTATRENILRNDLANENFPVFLPEATPESKADIVFANILAGPLVELAPLLTDLLAPGGKICLSGIIDSQREAITEAYGKYVDIEDVIEKESWLCVIGYKRKTEI